MQRAEKSTGLPAAGLAAGFRCTSIINIATSVSLSADSYPYFH